MKSIKFNAFVFQKAVLKFVILLIVFSYQGLLAQSDDFCKTASGPNILAGTNMFGAGDGECPEEDTPLIFEEYLIKVYIHILRRTDGTGGQSEDNVLTALDNLKQAFDPFNIRFVWDCQISYIDDDDIFDEDYCPIFVFGDPGYEIFEGDYINPDGIDIFLFPEDRTGCGRAEDLVSTAFYFGGNFGAVPDNSYVQTQIISHEMGHCLGLYHTFHGTSPSENSSDPNACKELVNGDESNRSECGDYVCDTPADPQMSRLAISHPDCEWPFPWPDETSDVYADEEGDLYNPDGRNIMSYSSPKCNEYFTNGQALRMSGCISISPILEAVLLESQTITINKTWTVTDATHSNGEIIIYDQLIIENGATLTIEDGVTVRFREEGKLIIQPNARLILEGTLTNSDCSSYWQGIEVQGGDGSQYTTNGVRTQGRLDTRSGSVISNALTAVKLYGPTTNETGGQIFSTGTEFINNGIAVEFESYSNFWPYATSQQGQPRSYFGRFTDCMFTTNSSYVLPIPFEAFVTMTDVNGVRFSGCDFTNSQGVNVSEIEDYGWGIRASESGFIVSARCTGNTYPCNSFDRGSFEGLGIAIQVTNANEIRPYTVKQIDFEECYIGLFNNGVSNATIINNNFTLGQVPDASVSSDQIGVVLEMGLAGFTLQENDFTGTPGNAGNTAGTICRDLGEFNNEIRRNNYSNLDIGNLGQGDNATSPLDDDERGLTYLCNDNNVVNEDFVVGGLFGTNRVRKSQALTENILGQITYTASGNRFAYTLPKDFDNQGEAVDYYYYEQGSQEEPRDNFSGGITKISLNIEENTCPVEYCEPPCKTHEEVALEKEKYYQDKTKRTTAEAEKEAALASGDAVLAENKSREASHYRQQMDQEAYMVVLHTVYDTTQFDEDTLAIWVEYLDLFSADIIWALRQQSNGNYPAAQTALDRATKRSDLDRQDQQDLGDMSLLMEVLRGKAAHEVSPRYFKALEELTTDPHSFTGNIAKNILRNHGYYFPPIYRFPDRKTGTSGQVLNYDLDEQAPALKVYPNPNNGQFVLNWHPLQEHTTNARLEIRDLSGRLILEQSVIAYDRVTIDLKPRQAGIYYYQLQVPDQAPLTGKLIIQ